MTEDERYLTFMGRGPRRVVHWEHWSNPDAETYLTGIDYYRHPRLCRQRMAQLYPQLRLPIPDEDTPIPPPKQEADRVGHTTRWGDTESGWEHGGGGAGLQPAEKSGFHRLAVGVPLRLFQ